MTAVFTGTIFGVAAFITLILYLFGRSLVKPIESLQSTIQDVNAGELAARSKMNRKDELGELSNAFDKLLDERVTQLSDTERENDKLN